MLFNSIVFGPIKSRRLGTSLGVNLLPDNNKVCNFNCIYCECGLNITGELKNKLPDLNSVLNVLEQSIKDISLKNINIDSITFSGNGEPTLHPNFKEIVEKTINLRDRFFPNSKISVLTNGSKIDREDIKEALLKIDNPIIKIDSAFDTTTELIDAPQYNYSLVRLEEYLIPFKNRFILQTMFLKGSIKGKVVDNTTEIEINEWYRLIERISPSQIMIYTIDRETPYKTLEKVPMSTLNSIAETLVVKGYDVIVAG